MNKPTTSHNGAVDIGIDYHKRYSVFYAIDANGAVIDHGRIDHTTPELFVALVKRHPHVHFHFTPTHASWLNQIEVWFSILSRAALKGASFRSVKKLVGAIENFLKTYNETAALFEWTKIRVTKKSPDSKYANIIK